MLSAITHWSISILSLNNFNHLIIFNYSSDIKFNRHWMSRAKSRHQLDEIYWLIKVVLRIVLNSIFLWQLDSRSYFYICKACSFWKKKYFPSHFLLLQERPRRCEKRWLDWSNNWSTKALLHGLLSLAMSDPIKVR